MQIFISHRAEDHHLAGVIKQHIEYLSDEKVECAVSELIPGGDEWQRWISHQTVRSDLLLLLYTTADHDWDWCVREVSLFEGAKLAAQSRPRVTGFLGEGLEPLAVMAQHQFFKGTAPEVERFLRDLLERGVYSEGQAIVPGLITSKGKELRQARDAIASELRRIIQPEEYFHRRIVLRLPMMTPEAESSRLSGPARVAELLGRTTIDGLDGSLGFLGLNRGAGWGALRRSQAEHESTEWLAEVEQYLEASLPGVDLARREGREQILSMLYRSGNHYLPVIARVEYSSGWPCSIIIIFVKMPHLSDNPQTMLRQGIPRNVVFLSILARLTRLFRWGFLEAIAGTLPMLEADPDPANPFWVNFDRDVARAKQVLDLMERQGRGVSEIHTPAGAKQVADIDAKELTTKLWSTYPTRKRDLLAAIDGRELQKISSIMEEWQRDTKMFMLLLHDRLRIEIEKLEPVGPVADPRPNEPSVVPRAGRAGEATPRMAVVDRPAA